MKSPLLVLTLATATSLTLVGCSTTHLPILDTGVATSDKVVSQDQAVHEHTSDKNETHDEETLDGTSSKNNAHNIDNHAKHHELTWSYDDLTGPDTWGDMEGFEACKMGKEQSPINITRIALSEIKAPIFNYSNSDLTVLDNHHTVLFTPTTANNTLTVDGDTYTLKQFHYHAPSEHQLSGANYPVEIHFVHANEQGELAVVGVMLTPKIDTTRGNPIIDNLLPSALITNHSLEVTEVENIDINALIPSDTSFYHYEGSLTTPPCSEQVQWYIAHESIEVSAEQSALLMSMHNSHSRPIQPLGERVVELIQ